MNNTTKRSLMTSITALVLCFAMLLGTTFAWFTDEVSSSGNVIKTGNLDIVLKKGASNENGGWTWTENQGEAIFDYDKWEPGYTTFAALAVENVGSLDAKITAKIVLNGTPTILGEVIDVYTYVGGFDNYDPSVRPDFSDGNWQTLGTIADLVNGTGTVLPARTLAHGQRARMIVALHMREDAGNEYQNMDLGANFDIKVLATQAASEFDSFDDQYDADAEWLESETGYYASAAIDASNLVLGALKNEVTIGGNGIGATIPADVKVADGATSLDLSMKKVDNGNIDLGEGESATSFDVHIEGIAGDNTQPMIVNLGAVLPAGLTDTELKLYHTENGTPVQMTRVASANDFAIHNQYTYNEQTGEVSIYVASFSVFTGIRTSTVAWGGTSANGFASGSGTEADPYLINTPEQLAYFRDQVDGGNTYEGKFVALGADINLGGELFNPIGGGWAYLEGKTFNGTFDGQSHTIYNIYVNGWELDETGDQHSGTSKGAGLFSSVHNATIKNLVINGAEMVVETTSIGIVAGCAEGVCTFENIVVTNANLGNYQMRNGGIVGDIYITDADAETARIDGYTHVFKNITVDSTVKLSSMWGDFDTGNGGVVGGRYGDTQILMQNVIVACELDVFSDVTAAYQWYAYRRCGMLLGYTGQNSPKQATNAAADFLTCDNVNVYYGDWVNYNYYQFAEQTDAQGNILWNSNYPWVRAEGSDYNGILSNVRYGNPIIKGEKINTIELAEANCTTKTAIPFNQLYGGGQGVYGCADHKAGGVTYKNLEETKTVYFQNNWKWTELKIHYWYENGDNRWTTIVDGIPLTDIPTEKEGGYDLYTFEIPAYVAGFKIEGYDSTKDEIHSTLEISSEDIVDGNIYWFVFANNEYSMATSKYENGSFETHEIYLVGKNINNWTATNEWKLTKSADGKTWTGTFTIANADEVKLYNALVVNDYASYIAQEGIANNKNTSLAPGKYKFTYSVEKNSFTCEMIERKIYLKPTGWESGARFAVYVWNASGNTWYSMTKESDGTYSCYVPVTYTNIIFGRMNSSNTTNSWDTRWNQSADETIPNNGNNLWTVTTPYGDSNKSYGSWSTKK